MSDIYSTLNPQQQEAVYHTEGPLLILAGAGSGKTRVLTHRIAYLIDKKGINPWNILAITFTNKAASEMRERVDKIVGFGSESVWVSTFHSTCVRILRRYIDRLGYDTRFAIYDAEDQKTLMKEVCRKLNIDTKKTKERSLLAQISHAKDELITPDEMELNAGGDFVKKKVAEVYREYQAALRRNNALDFDDLIVKTVELFQNCGDVLENYQYGCGAKWVVLTHFYLTQWYLTQLLNAGWERSIDIAGLAKSYPDIKRDLKMFGNNCFDDDKNFTPTQEMENIIGFYGSQKSPFARFKLEEGRNHTLFDVVNSIKLEELKENEKKAQEIDNDAFSDMIFRSAEEAIKREWGFDPDLVIKNENRYFSVLFEKCPEAINFNESVTEWIIASIIMDIKGYIKKTILKNDGDYEKNANAALHKNIKYITPAIKGYIQSFYSNNPQVKDKFLDIFEHCDEIKSKLLSMAMVTENGFRFNCSIEKVEVRALSDDELSKTVAEYQRADGQFVYNGIFMPREKIVETIKSKYVVLLIVVKHQVESSEDTVFELDF